METKIKSVAEFTEAIIEKTLPTDDEENSQIFWFRGEGNIDYETPLVPKSYRTLAKTLKNYKDDSFYSKNIKKIENNINAEFNRRAQRYISSKGIENSHWNRYFLMQHYKIKTRLLDWTENAILALFFAISDKSSYKNDSKVWILQPYKLNDFTIKTIINTDKSCMIIPPGVDSDTKQALQTEEGKISLRELTRRYLDMDFENESKNNSNVYYPLAIYPTYLDERMTSQKTCFTIFGNKVNGLLSNKDGFEFLNSVTVEGGLSKTNMLKELRILGIDFESIFPDLDGIGLSIDDSYKRNFSDNRETMIHVIKNSLDNFKTD